MGSWAEPIEDNGRSWFHDIFDKAGIRTTQLRLSGVDTWSRRRQREDERCMVGSSPITFVYFSPQTALDER
jgi:hypothetical protein